jgi:hypothetical protein
MRRHMIKVTIYINDRNVYAGRIWPALASSGRGKTLVQVTAPLPMAARAAQKRAGSRAPQARGIVARRSLAVTRRRAGVEDDGSPP